MRRAALALAAATLAACAGPGGTAPAPPSGQAPAVSGEVVVFAAASLTEPFTRIGADFEAANPGTTVTFNFAGSSGLAQQLVQGAPADVFAAASPATMRVAVDAEAVTAPPAVFARNKLRIAVPDGNPAGVTGLADLGEADLTIALCAAGVPCGAASATAFQAAGVTPRPDTLEPDVKAVLAKVRLGEVDAGLVYETDVLAAGGEVDGIAFPEADAAVNEYPIAPLAEAPNTAGATAFVEHVRSDAGRAVLADAGFTVP